MTNEIKNSVVRLVSLALIGTSLAGIMAIRNREPEVRLFYTPACWSIAEPHFEKLDKVCGSFSSEGENAVKSVDKTHYQPVIQVRNTDLILAGCNPEDENWDCVRGYQRHYARREPNRL